VGAIFDPEIDDVDDPRMLELGEDLRFSNEESISLFTCLDVRTHPFYDNGTSESLRSFDPGEVNSPHAAFSQKPHHTVATQQKF
jgi:hypothetical protein